MEDRKDKKEDKRGLDNSKYEVASELGVVEAGLQGVKEARLGEDEVREIVSRFRRQMIGFK